jgi:flagellar biosynthetic protein FliR
MMNWQQYVAAAVLVGVRLSGLFVFAPFFSSPAIAPRLKAGFVFALTVLLAPVVPTQGVIEIGVKSIVGELGVGFVFGLCLLMLNEALLLAGALMGMSFSFSLVNLLDPNTMVETPVLGQMLGWLSVLDRVLLAGVVRSFCVVPVGHAVVQAATGAAIVHMASGIFLAGLQLAAPVMSAALAVEMTIAMVSRLAPMLPAQVVGVPIKTLVSYIVLAGSLAMWPGWIERHFTVLLDRAGSLLVRA